MSTLDLNNPVIAACIVRGELSETLYRRLEEALPCAPLTDEQLARMNKSLGFAGTGAKGHDYRPYCCRDGCDYMPRMMRIPNGFQCWDCKGIWDLTKEPERPTDDT